MWHCHFVAWNFYDTALTFSADIKPSHCMTCLGQLSYCFHNTAHPIIHWLCILFVCLFQCFTSNLSLCMSYSVVFVYVRMCCTESKCIPSTEKVFDKTQNILSSCCWVYSLPNSFSILQSHKEKMAMHGWNIWLNMLLAVFHALPMHNSQDQVLALSTCLYGTCLCHCSPLLSKHLPPHPPETKLPIEAR